jgi:(1->4)-alpha-D-glucan 1-alpha-D-glucosylmutase
MPHSLNATSTHDTKRGEDSRIRLNWLSAVPDEWIASVTWWRKMNRFLTNGANDQPAPVPNDEYLIYQALLGAFPEDLIVTDPFRDRFHAYLTKALREGKTTSSWDHPDEEYEQKCHAFVTAILQPESIFLEDFTLFVNQAIRQSMVFSLSQLLIKLTAPGIPDIYQGADLWETSLVDPDNRRPVDYTLRAGLLKRIKEEEAAGQGAVLNFVLANRMRGAAKLYTIYRTLALRNRYPSVFSEGDYIPIQAEGPYLSYIRRHEGQWVLVVVPLIQRDAPEQDGITLSLPAGAPGEWTNIFTGDVYRPAGGTMELKDWRSRFPVALLQGEA